MKWVVSLLIALNIALFGFFKLSEPLSPAVQSGHEPIKPEGMQLLSPAQLAALPRKVVEVQAATAPTGCYEWGSFPTVRLDKARAILDQLGVKADTRIVGPQEAQRYWVYIPPRGSFRQAQARVEELRALGVEQSFIVQEPQWRNAISLGVFKDEALATRLEEELRARGVADVVKAVRNQEGGQSVFYIREMSEAAAEELRKFKPEFPSSELKQAICQ